MQTANINFSPTFLHPNLMPRQLPFSKFASSWRRLIHPSLFSRPFCLLTHRPRPASVLVSQSTLSRHGERDLETSNKLQIGTGHPSPPLYRTSLCKPFTVDIQAALNFGSVDNQPRPATPLSPLRFAVIIQTGLLKAFPRVTQDVPVKLTR